MGYMKHHSIIVTSFYNVHIENARKKAVEIFEKKCKDEMYSAPYGSRIVGEIIEGLANSQYTFFIAPDGSKEYWETSNNCNNARKLFLDWLQKHGEYCEFIEVIFGGDDEYESIIRTSNKN